MTHANHVPARPSAGPGPMLGSPRGWAALVGCCLVGLTAAGCSTTTITPASPSTGGSPAASSPSATAARSSATSPSPSATPSASSTATPSKSSTATPSKSSTANPSKSSTADSTFQNAVTFTREVQSDHLNKAEKLVSPKSTAAHFVDALQAVDQARKINRENSSTGVQPSVTPNPGKHTIKVTAGSGSSFTWGRFVYDSKKRITSWRVGSKPLSGMVSTKTPHAKGFGTTVSLVAGYQTPAGDVIVVARFKATKAVALNGAVSYKAGKSSKKADDSSTLNDLKKGKSTSAYYVFKKTKLGGKITIPLNNPGYTQQTTVTLKVS